MTRATIAAAAALLLTACAPPQTPERCVDALVASYYDRLIFECYDLDARRAPCPKALALQAELVVEIAERCG